jgi:heat shock protein HtpX
MKNQLRTALLLGALSGLLLGIGALVAPGYLYVFAALALLMNLGAYFYSDRIVLAMNHAQELSPGRVPWLHAMVAELARDAGIPMPRLYLIPEPQPNAFATGRNPEKGVVAVTSGILELLDRRELRGVLAHEIGHIKNRDILVATIAAAIATIITYAAQMLGWSALLGGRRQHGQGASPLVALLFALLAPIAATIIQLAISRSREYLADETGARLSGDPDALATALLALQRSARAIPADTAPATASLFIVNPLAGGSFVKLFSTHPPIEERVARLRQMGRADRPDRPVSVW